VNLAAITLCVASQRVFIVFISLWTQSGNFWLHPCTWSVISVQQFILTQTKKKFIALKTTKVHYSVYKSQLVDPICPKSQPLLCVHTYLMYSCIFNRSRGLDSRPWCGLSVIFHDFPQFSRQKLKQYLKIGHNHFISRLIQLNIHNKLHIRSFIINAVE
jgi:hypothetical protein